MCTDGGGAWHTVCEILGAGRWWCVQMETGPGHCVRSWDEEVVGVCRWRRGLATGMRGKTERGVEISADSQAEDSECSQHLKSPFRKVWASTLRGCG